MMRILFVSILLVGQLSVLTALPKGFIDEPITSINGPMSGTFAPNPRKNGKPMLLIASESNIIYAIEDPDGPNTIDSEIIVADLSSVTCTNGPRGLFSMMVHPDFQSNRYIFLFYTRLKGNCDENPITGPSNRLSRFTIDPKTLKIDIRKEVVLLETPPLPAALHDGGAMSFGNDGLIYLVTGDSAKKYHPPDLTNLFGKLIRVDINGNAPQSNPYTKKSGGTGVECAKNRGVPPKGSPSNAVCSEIYAYGFRNPFRMAQDINTKNKVRFVIGDVGEAVWEEISEGGTDYEGKNYGWGEIEGPCSRGSRSDCPEVGAGMVDPFYYYQHSSGEAVVASVFVPTGLWPAEYKYLFIEYVHGTIFNLIEDKRVGCRECTPPRPDFRNEIFHNFERMVDMFFAPYKNTKALYYLSRAGDLNVRRIRYIGNRNQPPKAVISVAKTNYKVNEVISFIGRKSSDIDRDRLTFVWNFGDRRTSTQQNPKIKYSKVGAYKVQLTVRDTKKQKAQAFVTVYVGTLPTAVMESPAYGDQFFVGQKLSLSGRAKDSNNRPIPDAQIFWEVQQIHGNHYHPFLDSVSGNNFELHPAPSPEDLLAARNSFLKVFMHVVDSDGLTKTISRNIYPEKVYIDIDSTGRRGLKVLVDDFAIITPATIISWQNHKLTLIASDQGNFVLTSWSIAGGTSSKANKIIYKVPEASSKHLKMRANFKNVLLRP
jgi:PKD repeat protein